MPARLCLGHGRTGGDPQEQFASPFSYAGNNPVMNVDPDGQFGFLAAALAGAISSGIRYASNLSQTGGDWNWNDFGKTVGLAAASAGLSSELSSGISSGLYNSGVSKATADYIGGFGANLIAGSFASGGIPNDPAQVGAIIGSSITNAGFYSNPITVSRELLDQVPWAARGLPQLDEVTITVDGSDLQHIVSGSGKLIVPWWWGNTPYATNPVTKAVIDGQRAGAAVIFEVASILAPVPKIGLLAKGYRFLRGAKAVKAASSTARAYKLGIAGEKAVGITGSKARILVNGRTRIPDRLTKTVLEEVKNVRYQAFTRQLRDFHAYSQQKGLKMILYTRSNTVLSKPLRQAVNNNSILLKNIPGL